MGGDFVPMLFAILFASSWFDSFWVFQKKNLPSFGFHLVLIPQEFYQKIVSALRNPNPTRGRTAQQSTRNKDPSTRSVWTKQSQYWWARAFPKIYSTTVYQPQTIYLRTRQQQPGDLVWYIWNFHCVFSLIWCRHVLAGRQEWGLQIWKYSWLPGLRWHSYASNQWKYIMPNPARSVPTKQASIRSRILQRVHNIYSPTSSPHDWKKYYTVYKIYHRASFSWN